MQRRAFLGAAAAWAVVPPQALAEVAGLRPQRRPGAGPLDPQAAIAASGIGAGSVSYALRNAVSGALLESGGPGASLPPASTLKAVTAAYALDRLGAGHRFATRVMLDGDRLILAGGGDPTLDTDRLAGLARRVAAAGLRPTVFAVWGGALPRLGEISDDQARHVGYNPAISGIILNFNRVHLGWRDGASGLSLQARAAQHSPRAWTIAAEAVPRQLPVFAHSDTPEGELWTIARGSMARAGSRWLPVRLPELYAGDVFQTLCRAEGLALPAPEIIADLPPTAREVARSDSPPLAGILRDMLDFSTNITAEAVGLAASGARDLPTSGAAMRDWLGDAGGTASLADHSGLSGDSRITAATLSAIMADRRALLAPLLHRAPARGHILAKTGTLNFVSNLTGLIRGAMGQPMSFAIMISDAPRHAETSGTDLPPGMLAWTARAQALQLRLAEGWAARPV